MGGGGNGGKGGNGSMEGVHSSVGAYNNEQCFWVETFMNFTKKTSYFYCASFLC